MEGHRADVVQMPQQREQASPQLVVPHLQFVAGELEWKEIRILDFNPHVQQYLRGNAAPDARVAQK